MKSKIIFILIFILVPISAYLQVDDVLEAKLDQKVSSMEFRNTNIEDLLRLMARQNSLNIVLGPEIQGRVSVSLKNVAVKDVLNTVLNSLGFHYIVDNNIILIKSFERSVASEISTRVFNLKYQDAYDLIQPLTTLLTTKGKIEALQLVKTEKLENKRSDILVISDIAGNLEKIAAVIEEIDVPEPQLQIEVRLIETILGETQKLGFDWPKRFGADISGAVPENGATTGGEGETSQQARAAYSEFPLTEDSFNLGILSIDELKLALDLLEQDKNSKLVSNPKISTLNKKKAKIRIGTTIPIAEVSRGVGGDLISYKDKDIDVSLEVTPRILPNNKIFLEVHPQIEEIIGYTGSDDFPQPITSVREITTNITVENNQTIVLGGMVKESKQKVVNKVWLLGDIPLLGYLFQSINEENTNTDLLIFITPKVLE